ncbi:MAG: DUF2202 domain-containing protein [Lewinella sp.]|nr:DUF2202 domain-containing protein [Lewinella sp.]
MKNLSLSHIGSWILLIVLSLVTLQCESGVAANDEVSPILALNQSVDESDPCACLSLQFPQEDLSDFEIESLQFMREEEKLARDVYLALAEVWSDRVFTNISQSEQRHMDAIGCLLDKYGLSDPVGSNGPGEFTDPDLQALYGQLVEQGSASLEAGMTVGATIEDLDINDLQTDLEDVDNADITAVYGNLTRGSRNHLRAFNRRLTAMDVTYAPAYIDAETFATIISGTTERGTGLCAGNGQGSGNGRGRCGGNGPGAGLGNGPGNGPNCPNGLGQGNGQGANCPNGAGQGAGPGANCPNGAGQGNGPGANCPNGVGQGTGNGPNCPNGAGQGNGQGNGGPNNPNNNGGNNPNG